MISRIQNCIFTPKHKIYQKRWISCAVQWDLSYTTFTNGLHWLLFYRFFIWNFGKIMKWVKNKFIIGIIEIQNRNFITVTSSQNSHVYFDALIVGHSVLIWRELKASAKSGLQKALHFIISWKRSAGIKEHSYETLGQMTHRNYPRSLHSEIICALLLQPSLQSPYTFWSGIRLGLTASDSYDSQSSPKYLIRT